MQKISMRQMAIALLSAFCLASCQCGGGPNDGYLEVEPSELDFGAVPVGLPAHLTVTVRNLGKKAFTVELVAVEGEDFETTADPMTVPPGQRQAIAISFSPTSEGNKMAQVRWHTDAANVSQMVISARGIGVPRLTHDGGAGGGSGADADGGADAGLAVSPFAQQAFIKASNTDMLDRFGSVLALSADGLTLAVGAFEEASPTTGINSQQTDNSAPGAGAVYVFVRSGVQWTQQAFIKASNTGSGDRFGGAVALSRDGNTLAVGAANEDSNGMGANGGQDDNSAPRAGAVYIFSRSGATWTQQAYVKAPWPDAADNFGLSVALSGSGDVLAVGAPYEDSGAAGIDGNAMDNTSPNSGAAYLWRRAAGVWAQEAYFKNPVPDRDDLFGYSVALSDDGRRFVVGVPREDSSSAGVNQTQASNDLLDSGAVLIFVNEASVWRKEAYFKAAFPGAGDSFGEVVAISGDGIAVLVTAPNEDSSSTGVNGFAADNSAAHSGAAYLFVLKGGDWSQEAYFKASNTESEDVFGTSAALNFDGTTAVVGASMEDGSIPGVAKPRSAADADNGLQESGAAYVFRRAPSGWALTAYVKSLNPGRGDFFGDSASVSGDGRIFAIGASGESSDSVGINPVPNDVSPLSGAGYVFSL